MWLLTGCDKTEIGVDGNWPRPRILKRAPQPGQGEMTDGFDSTLYSAWSERVEGRWGSNVVYGVAAFV